MDKKAMQSLSYGLYILTAREQEKDNGCVINTAVQVANNPDRLSIAVSKDNYTCGMIERTGLFNIASIAEGASFEPVSYTPLDVYKRQ